MVSSVARAAAAAAVEVFLGRKFYTVAYYIQFQDYNLTTGTPP